MIEVRVLAVRPHPDQATHNPGSWAVQLEVSRGGTPRTFWRWYATYELKGGQRIYNNDAPHAADIIERFWSDTFAELHGFSFNKADPTP